MQIPDLIVESGKWKLKWKANVLPSPFRGGAGGEVYTISKHACPMARDLNP
jgi:hypothetical protein